MMVTIGLWNVAGGVAAVCILYVLIKKWQADKKAMKRKNYSANTVILHQFPRGPYAPSLSPYPIKLETFLRMAKIPYQNEFGNEMSSKNKNPWITFNGQDMADSQFIIEFLKKKFDVDVNSHLKPEQSAIAKAFQALVEDNLYWVIFTVRWQINADKFNFMVNEAIYPKSNPTIMKFFLKLFTRGLRKQSVAQGTGRHTPEEVYAIGRRDLQALSDFLGNKPFLMGDEPCEQDCTLFGFLCQTRWHQPNTPIAKKMAELPNLLEYTDRMKARYWSDWDDCITAGATRPATK